MTGQRTWASDEERESWQLDHIDAAEAAIGALDTRVDEAETTISDHETRITSLEGGGGGGMVETMWAYFVMEASAVDNGTPDDLRYTGDTGGFGTPQPVVNPGDDREVQIFHTGYTMLTVEAIAGSNDEVTSPLTPDEEYLLNLKVASDTGLGNYWISLKHDSIGGAQRAYAAIPVHVASSVGSPGYIACQVLSYAAGVVTVERTVTVRFGIGLIGTFAHDGVPADAWSEA